MNTVSFGNIPNVPVPSVGTNAGTPDPGIETSGASFSDILKSAVQTVDSLHTGAAAQVAQLLQGGSGDLNQVMIAVEKADVSFQLMMQVRNKIVSAYQDIAQMQF
ncbi:MAG TPA: flagellar hook-basal body complex protein FliE [Edaphobacter sp.]|jgi:flagellar hook-basal body complex protein FliE|uniref:flagellar hook-basal body complex protein FliE n=1 Tax=Edaphobacter sp. TaxID=1934404 RepID=UPI002CC9C203|nr:flagellar hook-basal body complex protein FliE [Edaphobacter sp.]HUZ94115.1 flagellar hook-basal body complex protein FliE [Edaphobacter sp.]